MARGKKTFTQRKRPDMAKNMPRAIKQELEQEKRIRRVEDKVVAINRRPELKYFDTYTISQNPNTAGEQFFLNGVTQGVSQVGRIGGQITMKSLLWRYSYYSASDLTTGLVVRRIIYIDRQANGEPPPISGSGTVGSPALLDTTTITQAWLAPRMYETIKRFKILSDVTFTLNPLTAITSAQETFQPIAKSSQGYLKLGQVTKYDGNPGSSGGVSQVNTNSLYILHICSEDDSLQIIGGTRLYFTDE